MFAIPLVARAEKAPPDVRVAAASGLLMTLLYVILSVFPIINVRNASSFTAKVSGVVIGVNALGALYFWRVSKCRRPLDRDPLTIATSGIDPELRA
jgi:hypothetical protein